MYGVQQELHNPLQIKLYGVSLHVLRIYYRHMRVNLCESPAEFHKAPSTIAEAINKRQSTANSQ